MRTTKIDISNSLPTGEEKESWQNVSVLDFVQLVQQMRHRQKRYENLGKDLDGKRELEKRVDDMLRIVLDTQLKLQFEK